MAQGYTGKTRVNSLLRRRKRPKNKISLNKRNKVLDKWSTKREKCLKKKKHMDLGSKGHEE